MPAKLSLYTADASAVVPAAEIPPLKPSAWSGDVASGPPTGEHVAAAGAGTADAGTGDTGTGDAGTGDTGIADAGTADAGTAAAGGDATASSAISPPAVPAAAAILPRRRIMDP